MKNQIKVLPLSLGQRESPTSAKETSSQPEAFWLARAGARVSFAEVGDSRPDTKLSINHSWRRFGWRGQEPAFLLVRLRVHAPPLNQQKTTAGGVLAGKGAGARVSFGEGWDSRPARKPVKDDSQTRS